MESPIIQRFVKVMAPDCLTTLRLPPIISKKVAEAKVEEAVLITSKGAWKVKVGQYRDGLVCFQKGWDVFVNEHGLKMLDFAVFEHVGNMHFKVTILGSNSCEKDFSVATQKEEEAHFRPTHDYLQIRTNTSPNGNLVPVEVSLRKCKLKQWYMSGKGWYEFCTSNNIKEGDDCIFQLVNHTTPASSKSLMMDVQVFPNYGKIT
ncbi:hypothetical protein ACH5RR_038711 [Cinchona calisaya]|uniref:TF-B3 domain-containing protein n=1 Tax=Cinchona calisaya TaxID=153742 RepID=A0ABD2XWM6_9GENT